MLNLKGKKALIMGLANDHSLAYGVVKSLHSLGVECFFTYHPLLEKRVRAVAQSFGSDVCLSCDVSQDGDIDRMFDDLRQHTDHVDYILHAIAFSDKKELTGKYCDTSLPNFLNTMNISCYSLTRVCHHAQKMMPNGGSIVTLTYYGAEKVMPNYNVMGVAKAALEASVRYLAVDLGSQNIRVNAISAGPLKTLAASGIGDFRYIFKWNQYNTPLKRNTTLEDVAGTCTYLFSDLASGVTGDVIHVDSGYHVVGMKAIDAPDIAIVQSE
jgi:enoyl-[acyl-carrier protein] reductase I